MSARLGTLKIFLKRHNEDRVTWETNWIGLQMGSARLLVWFQFNIFQKVTELDSHTSASQGT